MNFYDRRATATYPRPVMQQHQLQKYRREVVAAANGRVHEVGVGSGLQRRLDEMANPSCELVGLACAAPRMAAFVTGVVIAAASLIG